MTNIIRNTFKSMALGLAALVGFSGSALANDGWNGRSLTDGLVVSFYGNNGKYLGSENGKRNMRCNRTNPIAQTKFTVVVVTTSPRRIYLKASNGNYVRVKVDGKLKADATSTSSATLFTSNSNVNNAGQHSLDVNGTFLSSENGKKDVTVSRRAVGSWERWNVQAY